MDVLQSDMLQLSLDWDWVFFDNDYVVDSVEIKKKE